MIEEGNFISRERFLSMARSKTVCADSFYLGIDWAHESDSNWAALVSDQNDLVTMFKYTHIAYEEQIRMMLTDLEPYKGKIVAVRSDSTGVGDFPTEYLMAHRWMPMGDSSKVQFTAQSKNELYLGFEAALFREPDDQLRFSYPAGHTLMGELENQMTMLLREYKWLAQMLSPYAPEVPGAHDDAPTAVALALLAASSGRLAISCCFERLRNDLLDSNVPVLASFASGTHWRPACKATLSFLWHSGQYSATSCADRWPARSPL